MSFVDSCPSTEIRSNDRRTQTPNSRSAVAVSSSASVSTKQSIVAKFGEIMPAPLHCAAIRTVPPASSTASSARLVERSVVSIAACIAPAPSGESPARAARMPLSTRSTGRLWAIAPVEATATCSGPIDSAAAAAPWHFAASSTPRRPVAAFAQPLLTRTPRRACFAVRSSVINTGAAGAAVAVRRTALTASGLSQTSSATSGLPDGFRPATAPAARNPAGSFVSSGSSRTPSGTGTQREAKKLTAGPPPPAVRTSGSGSGSPVNWSPSRGCPARRRRSRGRCAGEARRGCGRSSSRARRASPVARP